MRKLFVLAIVGLFIAPVIANAGASALYGDYSTYTILGSDAINAVSLDASFEADIRGITGPVYSNMGPGGGYVSFGVSDVGAVLGADDYDSINNEDILLDTFRFVGGVSAAGGVLFFDFFDSTQTFVDGFGIQFAQAGNFIYTLSGSGGSSLDLLIPDAGFVQITADDGSAAQATQGQWYLGDAGPTVGSEDVTLLGGGDGVYSHNFELNNVPEPASLALLALGAFSALRRRFA